MGNQVLLKLLSLGPSEHWPSSPTLQCNINPFDASNTAIVPNIQNKLGPGWLGEIMFLCVDYQNKCGTSGAPSNRKAYVNMFKLSSVTFLPSAEK